MLLVLFRISNEARHAAFGSALQIKTNVLNLSSLVSDFCLYAFLLLHLKRVSHCSSTLSIYSKGQSRQWSSEL